MSAHENVTTTVNIELDEFMLASMFDRSTDTVGLASGSLDRIIEEVNDFVREALENYVESDDYTRESEVLGQVAMRRFQNEGR